MPAMLNVTEQLQPVKVYMASPSHVFSGGIINCHGPCSLLQAHDSRIGSARLCCGDSDRVK